MTVYDMVVSDLGLPVVNQFSDQINRIINSTRAVMLRFLRRRDWPEELDEILCSASVSYFTRKYPDYASGDTTAAAEPPEIASISDNGQTVSGIYGERAVCIRQDDRRRIRAAHRNRSLHHSVGSAVHPKR